MIKSYVLLLSASIVALSGCAARRAPTKEDIALAQRAREIGMTNNLAGCRDAARANPNDAAAHMCIAEDTIGHNNNEAVQELRTVIRIQPDNRKAQFLLAQTLVKIGNPEESHQIYRQLDSQDDIWGKAARRHLKH